VDGLCVYIQIIYLKGDVYIVTQNHRLTSLYSDYLLEGGCLYSNPKSQVDCSIMTSNCLGAVLYQNKEFENYL